VADTGELVANRDRDRIAAMFNAISGRYDLMNRVMTAGRDRHWRRLAADVAALKPGMMALDVATGTGDMAAELARRAAPGGRVVGLDIAASMLEIAGSKWYACPVEFRQGDVLDLTDGHFDAATVAFGLRNFSDRQAGISAMAGSLKPGGRLVVLELTPSRSRLRPLIEFYEQRVIPAVGRAVSGEGTAYAYLPQSVAASLTSRQIQDLFRNAGLLSVGARELNFGTVAIVCGNKPE
jgi:demethylmenaquinone methyltransferase/2-methoxy-6-polyprenyl-1,4-benzoquinol methylase